MSEKEQAEIEAGITQTIVYVREIHAALKQLDPGADRAAFLRVILSAIRRETERAIEKFEALEEGAGARQARRQVALFRMIVAEISATEPRSETQ